MGLLLMIAMPSFTKETKGKKKSKKAPTQAEYIAKAEKTHQELQVPRRFECEPLG